MTSAQEDDRFKYTTRAGLDMGPVPQMPYRSQEFFELERDRVFGRAWLLAGRVEQIAKPGDYFVRDVAICKTSAVIVRGRDNSIRAFHNVCSHRGSQLIWEKKGSAPVLMCKYHNWTYATDGKLIGVPDEHLFDMDKKDCGLSPISLDVWEGWIFINLEREPSISLKDFLGDFGDYLSGLDYPFASSPQFMVEMDVKANWKVGLDAFSESYHIPALHNKTLEYFRSKDNPLGRLLDAKFFGPHRMASMYADPEYRPDPERELVTTMAFAGAGAPPGGGKEPDPEWQKLGNFLSHPAINPTKANSWSMDANCFFPNFKIDTGPSGFWTHQFWPLSPNEMHYEARWWWPVARSARQRLFQEYAIGIALEVLLEDLSNMERTQRGLDSGAKDYMIIQDNEALVRHSVHHVMKWAAAPTVAEAMA